MSRFNPWLVRVVVLVSFAVAFGVQGRAQSPKPAADQPQLLSANIVTLKPGMGPQYVDLQTKEVMPALQKGGSLGREVFSGGVFGAGDTFAFFTPVQSLAQYDAQSPTVKALGAEGAAALGVKTAAMIASRRTMLLRVRPDLSVAGDPKAGPARLALVSHVDTAPGRRVEFEALVTKEVLPAMRQAKVRSYSVLEVVYGESAGMYITAIGYDSYEAIGKGHPFAVVLGEDGARRLDAKFTGIVTRVERFIARHRPELSSGSRPGAN